MYLWVQYCQRISIKQVKNYIYIDLGSRKRGNTRGRSECGGGGVTSQFFFLQLAFITPSPPPQFCVGIITPKFPHSPPPPTLATPLMSERKCLRYVPLGTLPKSMVNSQNKKKGHGPFSPRIRQCEV